MRYLVFLVILLGLFSPAEARQHHRPLIADSGCNVIFPCEGVAPSPRGEAVVRAMGGFGSARKVYTPRSERPAESSVVPNPAGCPARLFCGCGASVRVFGHSVRELWLASNWFKFPRTAPAPGMVAVRAHHVFVLEADLGGGVWSVYDANSGGGLTRIHARSLSGYTIVNPRV